MRSRRLGMTIRRRIGGLDPVREAQEVARLSLQILHGQPMLVHALFSVAFARQVAIPSIARVLWRRGKGDIIVDTARRNDDTIVFFGQFLEWDLASADARRWIERMNAIHAHFPIANDESLYTLATLALEPQRLAALVGTSPFSEAEREGHWRFWSAVARAQGITGIPESRAVLRTWMTGYEASRYAPSEGGRAVTGALVEDFARRWFPPALRPLGPQVFSSLCTPDLRRVHGLAEPSPVVAAATHAAARTYFRLTPVRLVPPDRSFVTEFGTRRHGHRDPAEVGYRRVARPAGPAGSPTEAVSAVANTDQPR
ncbi:oxygenase MpaB family protein [Amycolatopsis cynarae]|uniref:Oxygenase MpaB family protein n=1 Tax=Amycolatopsis cynarae TaxID=2995223 RepID=A0ABY7BDL8_9PSEU|nr:oxygenase MpaB family protein [Amycolatopsis sp. HUAS 11-8]WAL69238.1 oxygenase MpaB family protein [Amycolatopsis sp. HUAS 11-8]